ncbi:MAG TPA: cytochrome c biogenesis protein CcsA [Thermoflexia bacterium]|jgi:heme exporter protein C|nr:cytochrome c biogenesis protein CcsA [Thermoflexia bacterium]
MERKDTVGLILVLLSAVAVFAALWMVFFYAPREVTMGEVQRIFYFHVASAWVGFFAFFITCLAGIIYLLRGGRRWDILALSSVEVGLTFITMTVITGSLWARPVWGTYWTWEPRLTISALQLLIYLAYGMLRGAIESPERRARFAAVYGIIAFVTVPLSWFAIRWWRTIHPDILTGGEGMAITPRMIHTLLASLGAFTLLYVTLLRSRIRLERAADTVDRLRLQISQDPRRGRLS